MKKTKFDRQNVTKVLSIGIMLMGIIHMAATFTPLIGAKLALLPKGTNDAFTYFSLMCGTLLILGGGIVYTLAEKVAEHPFVRKPYIFTLMVLSMDGVLAVCYMRHNPFAWIILALTICLLFANITKVHDHE